MFLIHLEPIPKPVRVVADLFGGDQGNVCALGHYVCALGHCVCALGHYAHVEPFIGGIAQLGGDVLRKLLECSISINA